ncbi:MAG: hypothetical protein KDH96_07585 [Candidatus Riesia sp.]|nr:hypothetical protein [Candidatus Riesia sp.]
MSVPTSYTLQVKRVFLNFLQAYFRDVVEPRFRWSADVRSTKIVIADKYSVDKPVNEQRPLIILSRQAMRPAMAVNKQLAFKNFKNNVESYIDFLEGSVVLNCMAKSAIVAEDIAHLVQLSILAYRDKLKGYNGIHTIRGIQIGEEQAVVIDSNSTLINVPVVVQFTKNIRFTPVSDLTSVGYITLTCSGQSQTWYEALDYDVYRNRICFYIPLSGICDINVTYLDNTTLVSTTENFFNVASGTECIYLSGRAYAYQPVAHEIRVDAAISGITYHYPTDSSITSGIITYSGITNSGVIYSGYSYVSGFFSGIL